MLCCNCKKSISDDSRMCCYCEAKQHPPPSQDEMQVVRNVFSQMGESAQRELMAAFFASKTQEEFANRLPVGGCPKCSSSDTDDCENDPIIDDICVGRCFACGQLWCLECGRHFTDGQSICECHRG